MNAMNGRTATALAGLLAGLLAAGRAVGATPTPPPPPDWRDEVIYFVMIDRFENGDPRNDDQHAGEFDPADGAHYSGGDLAGVTRRLDYIRGLGATAVWITPPVAHQWWNTRANYGGYHGYWADDFSKVDAHFGGLADYRALADGLHARGMRLVQDIVLNHVADYFRYDAPTDDPAQGYVPVPDARGRTAPRQPPFDLNDPRRARDRAAGIYHWTPDIRDYADPVQEKTWQLAGLDDLDTGNAQVRRALRRTYADWIRRVGVDAFRIDTAFYVPPADFDDFLHARDRAAPGILQAARDAGKPAFHVFGEGFGLDRAFEDVQARRIEAYVRGADGRPLLPGMINFPLYGSALDVFARGRPTAELADRIERVMRVHSAPHLMPTFVDNHDVDRFLATGREPGLRQALLMLMTLPGIPTIYYGTEQGFTQQRAAMFAGGYGSGGRTHFDATSAGYRYLQRAIALRRADRVLSRGVPTLLASNAAGPGVLAWRMDHEGQSRLVVFNTADHAVLLDALAGPPPGRLAPAFAIEGTAPAWMPGRPLVLPARAGYVWRVLPGGVQAAGAPRVRIDPPATASGDAQAVEGDARPGATVALVLDGALDTATSVVAGPDGRWHATLRTDDLVDAGIAHRLVAFDAAAGEASAPIALTVRRDWTLAAELDDPAGDDTGPTGRYAYPSDPGWGDLHPGDLRRVRAFTSGGALRLDIGLHALSRAWNPANGFDHVALTLYIELPGEPGGRTELALQDARLPAAMRWHRRLRVGGWSNVLTASTGADATHEGTPVTPGATLAVDASTGTLRLTLPASALGRPASLRNARVYVTTWDYDGGYRALSPQASPHAFGGAAADAPKVLDDALVVLR